MLLLLAILIVLICVVLYMNCAKDRATHGLLNNNNYNKINNNCNKINNLVNVIDNNKLPCNYQSRRMPEKNEIEVEVDPDITGGIYSHRNNTRTVYSQRIAHGAQGLLEYNSSGVSGDVGVSVGPYNEGSVGGFDDGIPSNWVLPSTPMNYYVPYKSDYYSENGPVPYSEGLYNLFEPDHDPLVS